MSNSNLTTQERPNAVDGSTYKVKVPNHSQELINVYITVNDIENKPFEVFINCSDSQLYEWFSLSMVLISRLLRIDVPIEDIITDLHSIHSAQGSHIVPGKGMSPSLASRIGDVLQLHIDKKSSDKNE